MNWLFLGPDDDRDGDDLPSVGQFSRRALAGEEIAVLDEFQSAGVFVNWWQQIRYDLKTIVSTGWHHTLIPDAYLIAAFFQAEADAIEALEATISEVQNELAEAVETAQAVAAYEPEPDAADETVTAAVIKKVLKDLIDDLKTSTGESAVKELKELEAQEAAINALEKRIRDSKSKLKTLTDERDHKLKLKRLGGDEFKAESKQSIAKVEADLAALNEDDKEQKKKITALRKDRAVLEARIAKTNDLLATIGGQLTEVEAKTLILKKLYDLANESLNRYLNAEKRRLTNVIENLWDKYAVSSHALELGRAETVKTLDGFLAGLGYLS